MPFLDYLSKRVKLLRTERNESQQVLGDAVKLTKASVSRIENASQSVTLETLIQIADHYDVSIDFLLGRTDIEKVPIKNELILTKDEDLIERINIKDNSDSNREYFLTPEEKELLLVYNSLDVMSRGRLFERAKILKENSTVLKHVR